MTIKREGGVGNRWWWTLALMGLVPALAWSQETAPPALTLDVTLVGNAGVLLTDGATSLLVDLPYESGAFGYQAYQVRELQPPGRVLAVVTHDHRDHFDASLLQDGWSVLGPPSVTGGLPPGRVVEGDSVRVGAFDVVALATPHTADHRSYRVRWGGRVLHFTGDTEDAAMLVTGPALDVLFVTPWLACAVEAAGARWTAARVVLYHRATDGSDPVCADAEVLAQGSSFQLRALAN